nr:S24 family peptidase [Globicatella sp. PHS-GS-PNBC-21-1553]
MVNHSKKGVLIMKQPMVNQAKFCVVAADNSLSPEINQGDEVFFIEATEWAVGDIVAVRDLDNNIMKLKKLVSKDLSDNQLFKGKAIGVYRHL